jgi:hypothetical protein
MKDDDECVAVVGMRIGRGNRSTRRKPIQCHFFHHKSHMTTLGSKPGRRGGKPATNCLSYRTALLTKYVQELNFLLYFALGKIFDNTWISGFTIVEIIFLS